MKNLLLVTTSVLAALTTATPSAIAQESPVTAPAGTTPAAPTPTPAPSPTASASPTPVADEGPVNPLEKPPAQVKCTTTYCTYVVQNARASDIVAATNLALFGGRPLVAYPLGFLEVIPPGKTIRFWHQKADLRQQMISIIPNLDHFMEFSPSAMINVAVSIYSISREAHKNLDVTLTSLSHGIGFNTDKTIQATDGGANISLNMGTAQLSAFIGAQSAKGELNAITRVEQVLPNNQTLTYNNSEFVYYAIKDNITPAKIGRAGLVLGADVFLESSNKSVVLLKNFLIDFGVRNPTDDHSIINTIDGPNDVVLPANKCKVIVSTNTVARVSRRKIGITGFSRKQVDDNARLMITVCASPRSYEDFVADNSTLAVTDPSNPTFDEAKLAAIQKIDGGDLSAIFESLKPYTDRTSGGEPILGFHFDPSLATRSTIDRRFTVSVEGAGIKMKDRERKVQNLMTAGMRLDTLPLSEQLKPRQEIEVTIKLSKGTAKAGESEAERKIKLIYYSESNELERADGKYVE